METEGNARSSRSVLILMLVTIGLVLWATFTYDGHRSLQGSLDETMAFAKLKISRLEVYQTDDRVKSLARLLDKSVALADDITEWTRLGECDEQKLDTYASEQRLSGVLVLDGGLHTVMSVQHDDTAQEQWQELIQNAYIKDIVEYPRKTYTARVEPGSQLYDIAVVARRDAEGMLLVYDHKEAVADPNLSMDTLFADFPFELGGVVVVTDSERVVSTNRAALADRTVEQCRELFTGGWHPDADGIVRLRSNSGIWYGRKDAIEEYTIYMFFPAFQVFMRRNIICAGYLLLAAVIYLIHILGRSNAEKELLARSQKRLRIINAIGYAYSSITLMDLCTHEAELIKGFGEDDIEHPYPAYDRDAQRENVRHYVDPPYQEGFLAHIDMDTIAHRLAGRQSISYTFRTMGGRWILSLIIPNRYGQNGEIEAVLIAHRDVTAEREHELAQEAALKDALTQARQASRAKTNFLNNMSHDIRTPMNAIIGFTSLAISHIDMRGQVLDYLKKIDISSRHLLSLINDVLDMSRIENGNVRIEGARVHLPDMMSEIETIVQAGVQEKHQTLTVETDIEHGVVITDRLRLSQVLINIIGNAVKFTPDGGTIAVSLAQRPCGREGFGIYEFRIKDDGIGISEEFQGHIFDLFARERSVTQSGIQGTGLGLAIAKSIVDMMNGTITLVSEKGQGSEFTIVLELQTVQDESEPQSATESTAESTTESAGADGSKVGSIIAINSGADDRHDANASGKHDENPRGNQKGTQDKPHDKPHDKVPDRMRHAGLRALLAEDNALNREIAVAIMEEAGLIVDTVEDGADAVERIASSPAGSYDVIFMDIQMPGMDGYTAAREIRAMSDTDKADIPIYAMTAHAFEEDRERVLKAGMNGHIAKPIDIDVILAACDRCKCSNLDLRL